MKTFVQAQYKTVLAALVMTLVMVSAFASGYVNGGETEPAYNQISYTVDVDPYEIIHGSRGHEVGIEDFGHLNIPGKPDLPSKIFSVAIPPGAVVEGVTFETGDGMVLSGSYQVSPVVLPRVIREEDPLIYEIEVKKYEENYRSVYSTDEIYPETVVELVGSAGYRKYNLVDVRVAPFTYRPVSGQLVYFSEITIHVSYSVPEEMPVDVVMDNQVRTENIARDIIANYDQAQEWYPKTMQAQNGLYDFVIITLESLTSSMSELVDWEISKGRSVNVVTTSWINSNYSGVDLAEKMRNFLRDKYPTVEWGIEDVLLIGSYNDVPIRDTWQNVGYGRPETDYYYAELSLPDSDSWDRDGDRRYGEDSDPIDFTAEVNVGRIPTSNASEIQDICMRSVAYEQNNDPSFKKNILLLGGYFWSDTDNAVLMEYKTDPAMHPWMSDWTSTKMYEKNSGYWSSYDCDYPLLHSNVMDVWPNGSYAFINWAGHGSPWSCHIYGLGAPAFIEDTDAPSLNDDYPGIIFADACSNSDTHYSNIGEEMVVHNAVGFLGATSVAFGMPAWNHHLDGSSQSLDYFFTTSVTSGDYTQGEAHQYALREMYTKGLWYYNKYEHFQWGALWGNPNLGLGIDESVLIVDNSSSNFFIINGHWSEGEHPDANSGSARYTKGGGGERSAGWRVNTTINPGTYDVYTWKFEHDHMGVMATNTPFKVIHKTGESAWINIDQSATGNEWVYLGQFEFDNSSLQGVKVTNDADGVVIADAVKLVNVGL
jgi:hypothetical protein